MVNYQPTIRRYLLKTIRNMHKKGRITLNIEKFRMNQCARVRKDGHEMFGKNTCVYVCVCVPMKTIFEDTEHTARQLHLILLLVLNFFFHLVELLNSMEQIQWR